MSLLSSQFRLGQQISPTRHTDRFIPLELSADLYHRSPDIPSTRNSPISLAFPQGPKKVLNFSPAPRLHGIGDTRKLPDLNAAAVPRDSLGPGQHRNPAEVLKPFRTLEAANLRNDFYSSTLSWSGRSGRLAVGLGADVYIWSQHTGSLVLPVDRAVDAVTCVCFSNDDHLVVGRQSGHVSLYKLIVASQWEEETVAEGAMLLAEYSENQETICSAVWVNNCRQHRFILGTDSGLVFMVEMVRGDGSGRLDRVMTIRVHDQQICGLALNSDETELAVGSNSNSCLLWDIHDCSKPRFVISLMHNAAVKALAYCPWSPSLLATGGGSKDRILRYFSPHQPGAVLLLTDYRFWHTKTGTLLQSHNTKCQITSLIWSRTARQLVVTFGFGNALSPDSSKQLLLSTYAYPSLQVHSSAFGTTNVRVLAGVLSPDCSAVCVACTDETVKFFRLWAPCRAFLPLHDTRKPLDGLVLPDFTTGVLNSDLLELSEGLSKAGEVLR